MPTTQPDIRQVIYRGTATRLTAAAGSTGDVLIAAINSEVTPPLALSATSTASLVVNVGAIQVSNPTTGITHTAAPIAGISPSLTSATVTFPSSGTGNVTTSAGSATLTLAMSASQQMVVAIYLNSSGHIIFAGGTPASSISSPITIPTSLNAYLIGFVIISTNGSNVVQNISNSSIYQIPDGGIDPGTVVTLSGTQTLTNKSIGDALTLAEISTPSNPSSGNLKVYAKSSHSLFTLNSSGTESAVGGTLSYVYQTSSTTVTNSTYNVCNTSSAGFTLTLPSGSSGAVIRFVDDAETWATNNLTIAPASGQTIQGISGNGSLVCDVSGAFVEMVWDSTNSYWVVSTSGFNNLPIVVPGSKAGLVSASGLTGNTSGSSISSGYVGEYQTSGQLTAALTGGSTPNTLGSKVLPAGVWLIVATVTTNNDANTFDSCSINTTPASFSGNTAGVDLVYASIDSATNAGGAVTIVKSVSISTSTTYYLNVKVSSSLSSGNMVGSINATRIA